MSNLTVSPAQLRDVAAAVSELADDADAGLRRLDAFADDVLDRTWRGAAASAYAGEWEIWRASAQRVVAALLAMATALRESAAGYEASECASTTGFERIAS
jgi:WXG100 family type VII secretion target